MKLTKSTLRRIIKEEINNMMSEASYKWSTPEDRERLRAQRSGRPVDPMSSREESEEKREKLRQHALQQKRLKQQRQKMGQKQKGSEQELEAGDYGEDFAIIRDYLNDFSIEVKRAMKEINIRLNDLDGRGT
jgi:hypothetical protein